MSADPDPDQGGKRLPLIPEPLQWPNLRGTAVQAGGLYGYRAVFHGIRLPVHLTILVTCVLRGAARDFGRLIHWWHAPNLWLLESQAVASGRAGHGDAMRAHTEGKKTRGERGKILAVAVVAAAVVLIAAVRLLPVWAWAPLGVTVVTVLAIRGRPRGKPMFTPAVVPPKYEPPTPVVITRALGSLGIAGINEVIKDGRGITFVSDVHRDGEGWGCDLDLPHGVTTRMILQRREQLASGLRRPLSATWPEPVAHEHEGRLRLWIGFQDISKVKPKPWPLLRAGQADVFASVPFGTDPRGRLVSAPMFEVNWLIGAAPGQGKTSAVRVLACSAALDPLADLWIHEHAGKGDLEPLAKVCHRYVSGLEDDAIAYAAQSLKMLRSELERRSAQLKKIDRTARPDGKVTRELAGKRSLRLRPLVCFIDECQNVFMHPKYGDQAKDDAAYVIRLGRAYGIILVLATQRPDTASLPTSISGNMTARFCLRVPGQMENDMILGTSAYKNGYKATSFRAKTDAGLGWLKGDGDPQIARTFYLDLNATERVAARARGIREQAGTLSGYALGDDGTEPARDVLGDVLAALGGDAALHWTTLAERLAGRSPDRWADATADAVSAQCRALGVPSVQVNRGGRNLQGCRRLDVEKAAGV
jgi:S-DNA-T family DNA segregation ATPase FtsK/SpoIIIE